MSRSTKKTPVFAWRAGHESNKKDKRANNRLLRRRAAEVVRNQDPEEMMVPQKLEEVMERYSYSDDGKVYDGRYVEDLKRGGYSTHKAMGK